MGNGRLALEQALRDDGLSPWLTSLEEASSWRVVSLDLTPTLNYVPADLLNDIRGLYQTNGAKPEARRHADVDAFKYFGEVETTADAGLASEWA